MMEIKIKLLTGGKMPTKGTIGAAGYDCYAREDITVGNEYGSWRGYSGRYVQWHKTLAGNLFYQKNSI